MGRSLALKFKNVATTLVFCLAVFPSQFAQAEDDPFPGVANGAEIPGTRIQSSPGVSQAQWEATPDYQSWSCPTSSGRAGGVDMNFTTSRSDDVWFNYCVKQWQPKATVDAWAKYRSDLAAAQAAAEAESKSWNAANPGKQKCVQWGPITDPNGGTSSGGVCANPVDPGPNTTVPTESAPSVSGPTSTPPTSSTSDNPSSNSSTETSTASTASPSSSTSSSSATASGVTSSPAEDFSKWGSGTPYTRVLKGQLSTAECPIGYQAANGLIAAIGAGTFTECWPENAWSAYRLGGSAWEQFKNSGGTYDAKAEVDRRNKVTELKALAKSVAQTAADQTPGIQRCSKWSGYGETGEECAYTFVTPSSSTSSNSSTSTQSGTTSTSTSAETSTSTTSSGASQSTTPDPNASSSDPFPNLRNGDEIPNTRITSSPGVKQSEWEQTATYKSHTCPSGSGKATGVDLNFTISQNDDKWFVYCVKSFQSSNQSSLNTNLETQTTSSLNDSATKSDTTTATTSSSPSTSSSTTSVSSSETQTSNTQPSTTTESATSQTSVSTDIQGSNSTGSSPTLQTTAIELTGSVAELKSLVGKVVENKREARTISGLMNRLEGLVSKTSVKSIKLPVSSRVNETATSRTPDICSVSGVTVSSLGKGTCLLAYTVIDSDGNSFTTEKEIFFRK